MLENFKDIGYFTRSFSTTWPPRPKKPVVNKWPFTTKNLIYYSFFLV